jgi:hypothetical protein
MECEIMVNNNAIKFEIIIVETRPLYDFINSIPLYRMKKKVLHADQFSPMIVNDAHQYQYSPFRLKSLTAEKSKAAISNVIIRDEIAARTNNILRLIGRNSPVSSG